VSWRLGRERVVPPPTSLEAHIGLQYLGHVGDKVAGALAVGDAIGDRVFELAPQELRQGILHVVKENPNDWCLIRATLTVAGSAADDMSSLLGGFIIAC
jgi:hypothetical protein